MRRRSDAASRPPAPDDPDLDEDARALLVEAAEAEAAARKVADLRGFLTEDGAFRGMSTTQMDESEVGAYYECHDKMRGHRDRAHRLRLEAAEVALSGNDLVDRLQWVRQAKFAEVRERFGTDIR